MTTAVLMLVIGFFFGIIWGLLFAMYIGHKISKAAGGPSPEESRVYVAKFQVDEDDAPPPKRKEYIH